tara:strand:- start:336 stop:506 length:171 start_codon:yes stop_codon:yes gene_type:complete
MDLIFANINVKKETVVIVKDLIFANIIVEKICVMNVVINLKNVFIIKKNLDVVSVK